MRYTPCDANTNIPAHLVHRQAIYSRFHHPRFPQGGSNPASVQPPPSDNLLPRRISFVVSATVVDLSYGFDTQHRAQGTVHSTPNGCHMIRNLDGYIHVGNARRYGHNILETFYKNSSRSVRDMSLGVPHLRPPPTAITGV